MSEKNLGGRPRYPRYPEITKRAVFRAGGPAELARELGISVNAIYHWYRENSDPRYTGRVPAHFVNTVSRLSGISPAELRPDIFGDTP